MCVFCFVIRLIGVVLLVDLIWLDCWLMLGSACVRFCGFCCSIDWSCAELLGLRIWIWHLVARYAIKALTFFTIQWWGFKVLGRFCNLWIVILIERWVYSSFIIISRGFLVIGRVHLIFACFVEKVSICSGLLCFSVMPSSMDFLATTNWLQIVCLLGSFRQSFNAEQLLIFSWWLAMWG